MDYTTLKCAFEKHPRERKVQIRNNLQTKEHHMKENFGNWY